MAHVYEIRGTDVYPSLDNDRDEYGLPAFEIRGTELYPSAWSDQYDYGVPAFEIRGTDAYPSVYNDHDDYGVPAFEIRGTDLYSPDDDEISGADLALAAAAGVGFFAALTAYTQVRRWWQAKGEAKAGGPDQLAAPQTTAMPPPGWYSLNCELRYWNGLNWTEHRAPASPPAYAPIQYEPVATTPPRTGTAIAMAWILTMLSLGYTLPWAVAATRGRRDTRTVAMVNVLLGWTIVGWIAALVMACGAHET